MIDSTTALIAGGVLLADWLALDSPARRARAGIESTGTVVGTGIAGGNRFPTFPPPFDNIPAFSMYLPRGEITVGKARDLVGEIITASYAVGKALDGAWNSTKSLKAARLLTAKSSHAYHVGKLRDAEFSISVQAHAAVARGTDLYGAELAGWQSHRAAIKAYLLNTLNGIEGYYQAIGDDVSFGESMGAFAGFVGRTATGAVVGAAGLGGQIVNDFVGAALGDAAVLVIGGIAIYLVVR